MGRLIDADKLKNHYAWWENGTAEMTLAEAKKNFDVIIDVQPTVDAVEVVRCKDCKHREVQVDGVFRYEMCGIRNEIINLDGFCHMGKRREDAKEE